MKKKNLLLLALGAFMSLTSCSSSTNVDQYLPTDDPTTPVTITFWECLGHAKGSNLGKVIDAFNKKYEGKYEVVAKKLLVTIVPYMTLLKPKFLLVKFLH